MRQRSKIIYCLISWSLCAFGAVLGLATTARAYEDQISLDVELGYAAAFAEPTEHAGIAGVSASYGWDDVWTARLRVGYAHGTGEVGWLINSLELFYMLDVIQWVPYMGVGVDAFAAFAEGDSSWEAAAHAVFGLDYLISRNLSTGLDLRPYLLWTDLQDEPFFFTATLHISMLFDQ